jgi:5-methylcytosine-specific restriction endonuclease McrA
VNALSAVLSAQGGGKDSGCLRPLRRHSEGRTLPICAKLRASPRGAGHVLEGSDHIGNLTEAGAHMAGASLPKPQVDNITYPWCTPWTGRPTEYQGEAKAVVSDLLGAGHDVPWIYVTPICGTKLCLYPGHIRSFRAQRIEYPRGVCTYCGMPGYTRDHLLPVTLTGEARRKFVAVVPACKECNSAIGDRCGHRISDRREEAHRHIRRKYRRDIDPPKQWTKAELRELGPNLRRRVKQAIERQEIVRLRLAWPHDPAYDVRAFERSGFEDPFGMELL